MYIPGKKQTEPNAIFFIIWIFGFDESYFSNLLQNKLIW